MNRVKLWVFTLLVVAAGYLVVHGAATARRADAVAALDARLASAAGHVGAALSAGGREAAAVAALAATDGALLASVRPAAAPPPAPAAPAPKGKPGKQAPPAAASPPPAAEPASDAQLQAAAKAALERAEKTLGFDLPQGAQLVAATQASLARKPDDTDVGGLLRAAASGQPRRAIVRQGGALFLAAARPAGEGAAVVVLVPLDEPWARRVATAAGVDVTVAAPDAKPVTTARGADVALLQGATHAAGAGDVGRPGPVALAAGPVKLPPLPQPIAGGAPLRARAVPLEGVKGGHVVASIATAATVNPPAVFLWWSLAGLLAVLVVGGVLGIFVRSTEPTPQVPDELLAAAARIEKGDFAARAPALAGKFGTVATALNRAAEIAGPAIASRGGANAAPATTEEWFQAGARVLEPARAQTPPSAPAAAPRAATAAAIAAPVMAAPAGAPSPAPEGDEDAHWQQVFQDFLRTRTSCGESAEGLTFDRFRQKLEGNKAQLVAKYGCKTVRFQVYVKDGKAALKATPVK
jgi:hypothetical protein